MNAFIKYSLTLTFCFVWIVSFSQSDTSMSISLQQALDLGMAQRFDIKNQELAIQISESNRLQTLSKNLPQVNASIDFRYNAILATNLLPPGTINNSSDYTPVKFGTPYNTLTSITATQNLFNAGVAGDKLTNIAQKQYDEVSLEKYKVDAKTVITQSYYQVLLNQEHIKLTTENVKTAESILKQGESQYKNGTLIITDLSRYKLDVANAQTQLITAIQNYDNSVLALKTALVIPFTTQLTVTDSLEKLISNTNEQSNKKFNSEQRYEYKMESSLLRLNEIQTKKINRSYLPSVYVYGNASLQNQNKELTLFTSNTWYPFVYVGLHADIPIFDGFQKSRATTGYKLKTLQNKNNLAKLNYEIESETINTRNQLSTTFSQYQQAKENYELAQSIMQLDNDRYTQGTLTASALKNTEYSMQNAQNNYLTSIYNVLLAQLNYKKAMGEL